MSLRRWALGALFFCVICTASRDGAAAEPDAAALEKVVAGAVAKYSELFAKRDAAGLAALFTPEAEYVDGDGEVFHGRGVIQAELTAQFEVNPPGKLEITVTSIRPIADGVIVEEGASTFRPDDEGPVSQTRYIALHARQADGAYLLAAVRELAPADLTPHERLKDLAFLLGEWREESDGGVVKTNWQWSDDGVALVAQFTVRDAFGETRSGTHRVGWDPERKQFRSWIFDSDGGFADGWWSIGDDDSWSVRLQGVDADGTRIAATVRYVRDGVDHLTISQENRIRGDASFPPAATRVVRKPPEPGVAAK